MKANLNKKSLIQIVVLVLLLAGGGAAYLMQDEGIGFITDLFEEEKPAAPPPMARKPAAAPGQASAPARKAEPAIPVTPAKGQLAGKDFTLESASIHTGALVLRQGQDAAATEVRISRLTTNYEVPAGKKFKLANASGADAPVVEVVTGTGSTAARQEFRDKYTLTLEFNGEKDGKLPGKLSLALPGEPKSSIAGTFEAQITGFRIANGKPDLTADDTETLGYLALRDILKDDPDKQIKDPVLRDMRLNSAGAPPIGYLEASYRVGEGPAMLQRFQFVKEKGEWRVLRTLRADQIDEAHPASAPKAKDKADALFPYLAAKRLEANLQKKYPKKGIFVTDFVSRSSDKHKVGECSVTYRLEGNEQPITATYLFRLKPGGWALDRELGAKEKLNLANGRIEKRS